MIYLYLAGPIEQCNYDEIYGWRSYVDSKLNSNITTVHPKVLQSNNSKGILEQNKKDVLKCDTILSYIPKSIEDRRPSYGTIFEISFAHSMKKDIILVSDNKYLIEHPIIKEISNIFPDLDKSIEYINSKFY
jgi:nucleoside 2-deoxyribosyltransferase